MDVNVSVTVMEIYNEKIKDLLSERPVSCFYNVSKYHASTDDVIEMPGC